MDDSSLSALASRMSVVIPTYNYAHFLPRAIESVLTQTVAPLEIIVADDGSTDDTEQIVSAYEQVRYIKYPHMGVYALRAAVLSEIRGAWFVNLDADNRMDPGFIEAMDAAILKHDQDSTFAFAYPDMERIGDAQGRVERPEFDVSLLKQGNYIDMNAAIRLAAAKQHPFDFRFNSGQGDYDFFLTLVEAGYWGKHVGAALLFYRVHEQSITHRLTRARKQVSVTRRLVRKHRKLFSAQESRYAVEQARNRLLVSMIKDRSPYSGLGVRCMDWLQFGRHGLRHAEFLPQTRYLLEPGRFFYGSNKPSDVCFLFRDSLPRRQAMRRLLAGKPIAADSGLLFGYDQLQSTLGLQSNLRHPRISPESFYLRHRYKYDTLGLGTGDYVSVAAHLPLINQSRVVFATSDNTGLPALGFKACHRLSAKLIYTSIGLPERVIGLQMSNPRQAECFRERFCYNVDAVVAYGYAEYEWLKEWVKGEVPAHFVAFGVDEKYWSPQAPQALRWDCLCVGADPMRDVPSLLGLAAQHPEWQMKLICSRSSFSDQLVELPDNLVLEYDVPIERVKEEMLAARLIVLPVLENSYSGATTTLLQAMALGKPVVVSEVGAIRSGYGLKHGENVCMVKPGDQNALNEIVAALIDDEASRCRLGEGARNHVLALLTWNRYVHDLHRIILGCVAEDRTGGKNV